MSWAWLDNTDSWIQTCRSMAFLCIVAFKLLFTLAALSRKELQFAGGSNSYRKWWHPDGKALPDPDDKVVSSLLHPICCEQEEPKLWGFFFPPSVCSVPCWQLHLLESYGIAISPKTAMTKSCIPCWTAFSHEAARQIVPPAKEQTARGKPFPHTLQLKFPSPWTLIPNKSNPQNSHPHVQCLLVQCYL